MMRLTVALIAAVLVYDTPPDIVPRSGPRLGFFGTDLVHVSSRLEVVVPR